MIAGIYDKFILSAAMTTRSQGPICYIKFVLEVEKKEGKEELSVELITVLFALILLVALTARPIAFPSCQIQ